jgi:hypothetical protein
VKEDAMHKNQEKYRKIIKSLNLSKEQEDFIIHFIYRMMQEFVSAAFGKHPVQQAKQDKKNKTLNNKTLMVNSNTQSSFNATARNNKNKG